MTGISTDGSQIFENVLYNTSTHSVLTKEQIESGGTDWMVLDPINANFSNCEHPAYYNRVSQQVLDQSNGSKAGDWILISHINDGIGIGTSFVGEKVETPIINYTPQPIDEYIVIVNLPEDWETVHNYIINENEIDGIPNRKINCSNVKNFSLRSSIYEMSVEEAEQLRTHEKVECVELNPYKYPQSESSNTANRFDGNIVGFNRPFTLNSTYTPVETPPYVNGVRSNWGMLSSYLKLDSQREGKPWKGVGITSTTNVSEFLKYSSSGIGVDAVVIDSGTAVLHPEFIAPDGSYRLKDLILDGPYTINPEFFDADPTNRLETVTIDGVDIGTRPKESVARAWWGNNSTLERKWTIKIVNTNNPSNYKIYDITVNGGQLFTRQDYTVSLASSSGTLSNEEVNVIFTDIDNNTTVYTYDLVTGDSGPSSGEISIYSASTIFMNTTDKGGTSRSVFLASISITTGYRTPAFASIDTISISANYTRIQAHSKNGTNSITSGHGTAVASQLYGKSFGVAFEANPWSIRISMDGSGIIGSNTALDVCTIFHQAKKLISNNPNPTLINNSYGSTYVPGNTNNTTYYHVYRGNTYAYKGNGSFFMSYDNSTNQRGSGTIDGYPKSIASILNYKTISTYPPASWGGNYGSVYFYGWYNPGNYYYENSTVSTAAEDAISAGCIVVTAAGNHNSKLCDKNDPDFDNKYKGTNSSNTGNFTCRVGGVQKVVSGDHDVVKVTIRVGAIDCAVEPVNEVQGQPKYCIRKACYSTNGPMVDIFAPGVETLAAGYVGYEEFQRTDNTNFYDGRFGGTSSSSPITCSVIALYLEKNRGADQAAVRTWLTTRACKNDLLSDPVQSEGNDATDNLNNGYWSVPFDWNSDSPVKGGPPYQELESANFRGSGNLRGAPNKALYNPYGNSLDSDVRLNIGQSDELKFTGGSFPATSHGLTIKSI